MVPIPGNSWTKRSPHEAQSVKFAVTKEVFGLSFVLPNVAQHIEVTYAHQTRPPRSNLLSSPVVNVDADSHPKRTLSVAIKSWVGVRSFLRSLAAMIHAPVDPDADFKRCCMLSGNYDGSDRHYFFQAALAPNLH